MSAAANNLPPKWVMLEPYVSLRDRDRDDDESKAPTITIVRASGTTSWNAPLSVTFHLAEPPGISRLYARLPGFRGYPRRRLLSIMAAHQDLALFRFDKMSAHGQLPVQDLFVFNASDSDSGLKILPHCDLGPLYAYTRSRIHGRLCCPPTTTLTPPAQRLLSDEPYTGLLRQGGGFAVAEAKIFIISNSRRCRVYVDMFWLRSSDWQWNAARIRVASRDGTHEHDFRWNQHAVVPVRHWLCWIDYYYGILFADMSSSQPTPTVTFVRLPPEEEVPSTTDLLMSANLNCWRYRSVSAVDADSRLKLVKVDRHDGVGYGPLRNRAAGFTITCHTLNLDLSMNDDMVWEKDYTVTSKELWDANPPENLPRDILMFPQVDIDRPHVLHFLIVGEPKYLKKNDMWVVTIDMETKKVESFYQYINGRELHGTEDADLAEEKSQCPQHFLPCDFSKFLHL